MQITPISTKITNNRRYDFVLNRAKSNLSFCSNSEENSKKAQEDILILKATPNFENDMKKLRRESLEELQSYDDFVVASMPIVNKYTKNFKIKEDFFKIRAKRRLKKVASKFEDIKAPKDVEGHVKYHYWWGFSNKKFGSSYAFSVVISAISPYLKRYNQDLKIAKSRSLETQEQDVKKTNDKEEKIFVAKEEIRNLYMYLVLQSDNQEIKLPNSIMLESNDKDIMHHLVDWAIKHTSGGNIFVSTNDDDSNETIKNKLRSGLEKSQRAYKNTGLPNLIYCENFEKLLLESNSSVEKAAIKSLLSNIYDKYHATILFTTTNSSRFDCVLNQPHRIKRIKI